MSRTYPAFRSPERKSALQTLAELKAKDQREARLAARKLVGWKPSR